MARTGQALLRDTEEEEEEKEEEEEEEEEAIQLLPLHAFMVWTGASLFLKRIHGNLPYRLLFIYSLPFYMQVH